MFKIDMWEVKGIWIKIQEVFGMIFKMPFCQHVYYIIGKNKNTTIYVCSKCNKCIEIEKKE